MSASEPDANEDRCVTYACGDDPNEQPCAQDPDATSSPPAAFDLPRSEKVKRSEEAEDASSARLLACGRRGRRDVGQEEESEQGREDEEAEGDLEGGGNGEVVRDETAHWKQDEKQWGQGDGASGFDGERGNVRL